MRIVELILDEQQMASGIDAISIVEAPAIESNFVALKSHEVKFAKVDAEKRILMGPILIPDKPIYRKQIIDGELDEFYIYFSKDTVRKASQMFLMKGNQANATVEHELSVQGVCMVETWLKEDMEKDKSAIYGMTDPVGTWMGCLKVTNDQVWNDVKDGKFKGFSIEGYFADKMKMSKQPSLLDEVVALLTEYKKSK
jgi:Putative phage serine protease XkdF